MKSFGLKLWCGNVELDAKLSVDLVEIVKFSSASDSNHLFLLLKNHDLLHGEIVSGSNEVFFEKLYHNVLDMTSSSSVIYFVSNDGRLFESALGDLKNIAELKLSEAKEDISLKAVTCCTSSCKNLLYLVDNRDRLWVRENGSLCPIEINRENASRSYWKEQDFHHFMLTSGADYCVILMGVSNSLEGIGKQYCETSFKENETIYCHTESCPCFVTNESQTNTATEKNQSNSNQMKCADVAFQAESYPLKEISLEEDEKPKNTHHQQMCLINISKIACRANALSDKSAVHIGRILLDTEVWTCGNNRRGQLGMGDQVPRHHGALCISQLKCRGLKYLATGSAHTVALAIDGRVWAWGDGSAGQLGNLKGLNDADVRGSSSPRIIHWPLSIGKVIDIAAGSSHTVLLSDSGIVFTLGKVVNNSKSIPFELKASCDDKMEPIQVFASGNYSACVYSPIKLKKDLPSLSVLLREARELLTQALSLDSDLFPLVPSSPLNKSSKEKNQNYLDVELDLVIQAVTEGHRRVLSLVTLMVESLVWYERDLYLGNPVGVEYIAPIFHPDEYVKVYRAYLEAVCDLLAFEGFRDVQHYSSISIQRMKSLFPGETDDKIVPNSLFKPLDHLKFYLHLLETISCKIMCGMKDYGSSLNPSWLMQKVCLQGKTLSVPELSSLSYHGSKQGMLASQSEMCSLNVEASFDKVDTGSLKESSSQGTSNNNITVCPHGYPIDENILKAKKIWNTLNVGEEWNRARLRAEKTRHFWEEHNRGGMVLEKWRQRGEKNLNKKCSWQPRLHSQRLLRESRPSKPKETPSLWVARPATLFTSAASASSSPSSSSPSFVLLTDAFLQISPNGQVAPHNLSTLWVELLRDSWEQEQGQPIPQNALQLTMPEDTLTVVASNAEERMAWLKALQSAIMLCLSKESPALLKNATGIPPVSRNASYLFLRHQLYKDAIYTGGWLFGRPNGKGVMEWSDGRKIEGIFKDGLANGHARQQQPSVGTYDGQWKNGFYHGYGVMRYANGAVYEGEWREGLPEGHGIRKEGHFLSPVASVYVGDWVAGAKHGYGVMDDILTGEKYLGLWDKGEKHGSGLIVSLDGVYHEGTFVRGTITGHGVMVLEEGTHYEGELRGTGLFGGRGKLTLAPGGHGLEGMFSGSWDNANGVKINNGTFHFNRAPTSPVDPVFAAPVPSTPSSFGKLCVPPHRKWRSLFQQCREELGLKAEEEDEIKLPGGNMKGFEKSEKGFVDVQKVWENVAIAITRSQLRLKQKLQQQPYEKNMHKPDDSIFKFGDDGLVTIPNFGRKVLDKKTYIEVQKYLIKATESSHHPLGHLVASMTSAFTATYGGVRVHPLLLPHAVSELGSLTIRLYAICRLLFPALPSHENEVILFSTREANKSFDRQVNLTEEEDISGEGIVEAVEEEEEEEEVVTATGLLHPILLPRVHSSLFVLYALHNKAEDDAYWLRLRKLNSHDNLSLMAFLDVHRKFWVCASPSKENEGHDKASLSSTSSLPSSPAKAQPKPGHAFVDAVETLQQLKTTFCPLEKLEVIHKTFEHMACTIQKMMGSEYMGMDDLFPVFHFVVVRAQILQLGSEIHFVEDFIEPHLQNGELGMMFTTLKACYYQILQEKS